MGEKKARSQRFDKSRAEELRRYVESYLISLRALRMVPPYTEPPPIPELIATGRADVWPCQDGGVVLFYKNPSGRERVRVRDPVKESINDFIATAKSMRYFN